MLWLLGRNWLIGKVTIHGLGLPGLPGLRGSRAPGLPGVPGAPETLKLQVDRRSEMVWFAKGNEIHISDFCIANTMDIKYQLWCEHYEKPWTPFSTILGNGDYWIAAWMKSLESLNFMLGLRRTNGCQPIVKKNLGILGWTWGAFCTGGKASFMWF